MKHLLCLSLSLFVMACQTPAPQLSLPAPQASSSAQPSDRQAASGQTLSPSRTLPAAVPLPVHQISGSAAPSETRPAPATAPDALLAPVSVAGSALILSVQSLDSSSYLIRVEATGHTPSEIEIVADGQSIRRFSSPPFVFSWRPERAGPVTLAAVANPALASHLQIRSQSTILNVAAVTASGGGGGGGGSAALSQPVVDASPLPVSAPTPDPTTEPTPEPTPVPSALLPPDSIPDPALASPADPTPDPISDPTPQPTPVPTSVANPVPTPEPTPVSEADPMVQEILRLSNLARAEAGLPALSLNAQLNQAALAHGLDMANNGIFSHTGSDGSTLRDRVNRTGYAWRNIGENIAYGYTSAASVMSGWMNSDGHRANILNSNFREIGIAYTRNSQGRFYYVQVFGNPR